MINISNYEKYEINVSGNVWLRERNNNLLRKYRNIRNRGFWNVPETKNFPGHGPVPTPDEESRGPDPEE